MAKQLQGHEAVKNFSKTLNTCVKAGSGHFEFSQSLANCLLCCWNDNVFFSAAQTSCIFHSTHILLHVIVRNHVVVTEKN